MKLVRGAWKILVAIKDGLVLIFMLLFFGFLFAALSARPNVAAIRDGALIVSLDGVVVEQPEAADPFSGLGGGGDVVKQQRLRDVVRAIDAAKDDARVKAVVLDLDRFMGGYPAAVGEVAAAVGRVRASGKKVLAYATGYSDSGYLIAANASEIWVNPLGGTLFSGPGGSRLYYKGLADRLAVNTHVYKVGKYKSAVEPYTRADMSPEAREANQAMYDSIFGQWRQAIAKARPKARIDDYLTRPDEVVTAAAGDIAAANLATGLVDKTGDRLAFGKRVAELVGAPSGASAGNFKAIKWADWIEAHPASRSGDAIGVITIAGEIVDGKAGAGTAGGDTISRLVLDGLAKKKLKALVVRVDSPGGSALASEQIRQALLQAKAQGLPVVVSMGSLAASGGYWVSMAGDTIFADPATITGSIGIFGLLPTFEKSLAKIGITTDGVRTTPLSGQPDVTGGDQRRHRPHPPVGDRAGLQALHRRRLGQPQAEPRARRRDRPGPRVDRRSGAPAQAGRPVRRAERRDRRGGAARQARSGEGACAVPREGAGRLDEAARRHIARRRGRQRLGRCARGSRRLCADRGRAPRGLCAGAGAMRGGWRWAIRSRRAASNAPGWVRRGRARATGACST